MTLFQIAWILVVLILTASPLQQDNYLKSTLTSIRPPTEMVLICAAECSQIANCLGYDIISVPSWTCLNLYTYSEPLESSAARYFRTSLIVTTVGPTTELLTTTVVPTTLEETTTLLPTTIKETTMSLTTKSPIVTTGSAIPTLIQPTFVLCDPIVALHREEEDKILLIFQGNENYRQWKTLKQTDRDAILMASSYDEKYKVEYFEDIENRQPDAGMEIKGSGTSAYFFFGDQIEVHKYNSGSSTYLLQPSYPKFISAELNQAVTPPFVNAAHYESGTVYLVAANTVFQYSTSSSSPSLSYTFVQVFQFNENSAANPFSAGAGSPLSAPPSTISALYAKSSLMLAFSGTGMYQYERSTKHWVYLGIASTPCSDP